MTSPPPTKPPRGVKQGKETSGLLMSVIRTLSASESDEQREKERTRLAREQARSSERLGRLVAAHETSLLRVAALSTEAGVKLAAAGQAGSGALGKLAAARELLRPRRDDLRRLWKAARAHHHALLALSDIERAVSVERSAIAASARGHVLTAARLLASARPGARGDAKRRLDNAQRLLLVQIQSQLCSAMLSPPESSQRRSPAAELALLVGGSEPAVLLEEAEPELEARLSELPRPLDVQLAVLLEAAAALNALPDLAETYKVRLQSELLEVASRVTGADDSDVETRLAEGECPVESAEGRALWRRLWALRAVWARLAARASLAETLWTAAANRHGVHLTEPGTKHYWAAVQQVMQLVLSEHVRMEVVHTVTSRTADLSPVLSEYFGKKRAMRKGKLFRLSGNAVRNGPSEDIDETPRELLPAALPPLRALVELIERSDRKSPCSLRQFVAEWLRGGAAERAASKARADIDAVPATDWRDLHPEHQHIYAGAVTCWEALESLAIWAEGANWWGGTTALEGALSALVRHVTAARALPRAGLSSRWLQDDDIVRFLQELPAWRALQIDSNKPEQMPCSSELMAGYSREADILCASLADSETDSTPSTTSSTSLLRAALLCESAAWLAEKIRSLLQRPGLQTASASIEDAATKLEEASRRWLLLLHLELRVRCFRLLAAGDGARLVAALGGWGVQTAPVLRPTRRRYVTEGLAECAAAAVVWRWRGVPSAALAPLRLQLAAIGADTTGLARAERFLRLSAARPEEVVAAARRPPRLSELDLLSALRQSSTTAGLSPTELRTHQEALEKF